MIVHPNMTSLYQLLTTLALNLKELQEFPCVEQLDKQGASWVRTYTRSPNDLSTGKLQNSPKPKFSSTLIREGSTGKQVPFLLR